MLTGIGSDATCSTDSLMVELLVVGVLPNLGLIGSSGVVYFDSILYFFMSNFNFVSVISVSVESGILFLSFV